VLFTDAGAKELQTATRAGALDHRRGKITGLAELLGNGGGKWENGGGADDTDLIAGFGGGDQGDSGCHGGKGEGGTSHGGISPD